MVSRLTSVCLSIPPSSVCLSVFRFQMITWVNINGFSPNLVCALILWRSGLGLLMGKFCYLPETHPFFLFRMITWVNVNGFSPNLVCALILWRSGLGLLMCKFRQILMELSAQDTPVFTFQDDNLSKCQGILTKLDTCIDMKEIWFGIADGKILSMSDRVICPRHNNVVWYSSLTFLFNNIFLSFKLARSLM